MSQTLTLDSRVNKVEFCEYGFELEQSRNYWRNMVEERNEQQYANLHAVKPMTQVSDQKRGFTVTRGDNEPDENSEILD